MAIVFVFKFFAPIVNFWEKCLDYERFFEVEDFSNWTVNCETIALWCLWKLQSYFRGYTYIRCKFDILSYVLVYVGIYLYDSNFQVDLQQCIEYFYNFKEPVLVSFLGYKKHSQMFFQTFFSISVRRSRRILKYHLPGFWIF